MSMHGRRLLICALALCVSVALHSAAAHAAIDCVAELGNTYAEASAAYFDALGACQYKAGDYAAALEAYSAGSALRPGDPAVLAGLARSHAKLGNNRFSVLIKPDGSGQSVPVRFVGFRWMDGTVWAEGEGMITKGQIMEQVQ